MKQFETVTFKGTAVHTNGMMPQKGEMAPDFTAVAGDLSDLSLGSLKGKRVILNIFPSLDTSVCATSVRKFNVKAAHLENWPYPWIYLLHKDAFVRLKALRT